MNKLPISICFFTSTKGHFKESTYAATLDHLNYQIPLSEFGALYSHIKISPGEEELATKMRIDLERRGFFVEDTTASWTRGAEHQVEYLKDMRKASNSSILNSQPYMLLLEDDSIMISEKVKLISVLSDMVQFLQSNQNITSTRFIRKPDFDGGVPVLQRESNYFYSPYFDFQPAILRFRDFFLANKVLEDNWENVVNTQCEMAMRLALNSLSRSKLNHIVWLPEYTHTVHLGIPNYLEVKKQYNL